MNIKDKRWMQREEEAREEAARVPAPRMFGYLLLVRGPVVVNGQPSGQTGPWEPATFGVAPTPEAMVENAAPGFPDLELRAILLHNATKKQLEKALMIFQASQIIGQMVNATRMVQPVGVGRPQ